jgi:hypothetical protein
MLKRLYLLSGRILDGVSESFTSPPNATAREVRVNGALTVGMGFLCLALSGLLMFLSGSSEVAMKLVFAPAMAAYAFLIVGGYRLVFGANAKADPYEVVSIHRILFGVAWVVVLLGGLIFGLIWLGA